MYFAENVDWPKYLGIALNLPHEALPCYANDLADTQLFMIIAMDPFTGRAQVYREPWADSLVIGGQILPW
jgi:hypothetical protein